MKPNPNLCTVSSIQKYKVNRAMKSPKLHFLLVILFLAVNCAVCSGICHISACDALQEMKNEIAKYDKTSGEANSVETCEVRLLQLERRVRSVEQPGKWRNTNGVACQVCRAAR
jgi:hypothetical protein